MRWIVNLIGALGLVALMLVIPVLMLIFGHGEWQGIAALQLGLEGLIVALALAHRGWRALARAGALEPIRARLAARRSWRISRGMKEMESKVPPPKQLRVQDPYRGGVLDAATEPEKADQRRAREALEEAVRDYEAELEERLTKKS